MKTTHRVRFLRARSRGRGRDSTGGIDSSTSIGWVGAPPTPLDGVSDVIDGL